MAAVEEEDGTQQDDMRQLCQMRSDEAEERQADAMRSFFSPAHKKRADVLLGGRKTVKFKKCENLWFSENGVTSVTPFFRL